LNRIFLKSLLVAGLIAIAAPAVASPQRVMSLSLCTDELLLELLPPERIASVTYYAHQPAVLKHWPAAAGIRENFGSAEEIVALHPDLVLAGTFTTPASRRVLEELHFALLEVPPAENFLEIGAVTRLVGHALGRDVEAERLINEMGTRLKRLQEEPKRAIRVVAWGEGGSIPGEGTLFDAILRAAGGINIASSGAAYTAFDLEQLLAAKPDVIAYSRSITDTPSLNTDLALHPVLLEHYAHRRISYPGALYSCGTVASAAAAEELHASLAKVMEQSP
jgi:iron complex transport system substrate-binding protein